MTKAEVTLDVTQTEGPREMFRSRTLRTAYHVARRALPRLSTRRSWPVDFDPATRETCTLVAPYTMTSPERIYGLCHAVRYLVRNRIAGAIVECGVWKGGSMMAAARTLRQLDESTYDLYLFDTFSGMTSPTGADADYRGRTASHFLASPENARRLTCSLAEVQRNVSTVGYDPRRIHFVQGPVEQTIPDQAPDQIALLRLDTDWYESTCHEIEHLFPRLSTGGVLIVDDYGHWRGSRQAVDEFVERHRVPLLLNRLDYSGRIGVKLAP